MVRKTPKPAASIEQIAQAEGMTVGAVGMCLGRALLKLRAQGLSFTCRELAMALEANRSTEHSVRRTARGR